ncbi:MAG TPA: hypothetical protein VGF40_08790 [Thermoanaerobaculia bacterium]
MTPRIAPRNRWIGIGGAASLLLVTLILVPACCCRSAAIVAAPASHPPPIGAVSFAIPPEASAKGPTAAQMANVAFHLDPILFLDIRSLRGEMVAKEPGAPVNFDDKHSFVMRIDTAVIGMSSASLDQLMNGYVFAYPNPALRDLHIMMEGNQLRQEGVMHKVVDLPFTMWADVSVSDGMIRLHPTKIDICGINGLGLLKAVGMTLEKMLSIPEGRGVRAEGNDLLIDPARVLPPPAVELRLVEARVEGAELVQVYDAGRNLEPILPPHAEERNYMYFRGGTLRMGKLMMLDADMQVVDTDPADPFDFFLDRYNEELAAGFTRNQLDYGLLVFMRDFADLGAPRRPGERVASE